MPDRIVVDTADKDAHSYRLLTALVVPRPIAWVSTVSEDGVGNLAPHSFFTVASADPPMVQFTSVGTKDTLRNVQETGEFVVNLATLDLIDQVNATSAGLAPEVDEAVAAGVRMEPSAFVRPPRVADSPASLECRLHLTLPVGDSVIVIGQVVAFAIRPEVMASGRPAFARLRPVSRLGGDEWGLPPDVVRLTRPPS